MDRDEKVFKVLEIFGSIDGEGIRAGELTTFIRLSGCNLCCSWCDTNYSQSGKEGIMMSLNEIIAQVVSIGYTNITVTGGEPLIHKNINNLLAILSKLKFNVNVETNGSRDPKQYIESSTYRKVWFTIDYKAKSSGMQKAMKLENFIHLRGKDVIKFVVGSWDELEDARAFLKQLSDYWTTNNMWPKQIPFIYFSPVFGMIEPREIVEFMKKYNLQNRVRVQVQLHKILWDPMKRGV